MLTRHRLLLALLVLGNAVAFAGIDPVTRALTAALVLVLVVDTRRLPAVPKVHGWAIATVAVLVAVQLAPLPEALRRLLEPGLAELVPSGWRPLSVAPWSTVQVAAAVAVFVGLALVAARAASTRTGLPELLGLIGLTGAALAVLGLLGEAEAPAKVLLLRPNTGAGDPYGPFVNSNHFALAMELTLPAAAVLLAVASRHLVIARSVRQRSLVLALGAGVTCAIGAAALMRSGSRGGLLFLLLAAILTVPLWWRPRAARRWPWVPVVLAVAVLASALASTRLPMVRDEFSRLLLLEGLEGNDRWDLWQATWQSWLRAPVAGTGLGGYRHVIGLDKPATGDYVLEEAHNDWLEWQSTGGVLGMAALGLAVLGCVALLLPGRVRRLRFEYRYPLAGAAVALVATAMHEVIGFGLQIPLNRYLLALWIGVMWGVWGATSGGEREEGNVP